MKAFLINLFAVSLIFLATISAVSDEQAWRRIAGAVICLVMAAVLLTPDEDTNDVS